MEPVEVRVFSTLGAPGVEIAMAVMDSGIFEGFMQFTNLRKYRRWLYPKPSTRINQRQA